MLRKVLCMLVLLCFVASVVAPVFAARRNVNECLATERVETRFANSSVLDESEVDASEPAIINSVSIRNIPNASFVMSLLPIIARSSSVLYKLYYQIDGGGVSRLMKGIGNSNYRALWNTTASSVGWHTIYVYAKDALGKLVASTHVHVYVVRSYRWEVYYEIDYIVGHYPTVSVLNYMVTYWRAFAIRVSYKIDDAVTDPTPGDGIISYSDFWQLEKTYNDVWKYDDRAFGNQNNGKYTLKEKWVLWGTYDVNPNVGGYCYVPVRNSTDMIAGNYIFIAGSTIKNWEAANAIPYNGGEEIVFCHEAGHSIGVGKLSVGNEVYDPDYYSMMANMRLQNAKYIAPYWYYSKEYWGRADLKYYRVLIIRP